MKMLINLLCLASLVLAEPPVDKGYAAARSYHNHQHQDHHDGDHERSLSQEYGAPSAGTSRNAPSTGYEYNPPNSRSSNARGQPRFPPATVRVSFNQRFSSAAAKTLGQGQYPAARNDNSPKFGAPASRSLSQEYGIPSMSARTLSTEYGMPDARSSPSQEYGAPVISARSNQKTNSPLSFRSSQSEKTSSQDYSVPAARSQFATNPQSHGYSTSTRSSNGNQGYDAPQQFGKSTISSRRVPSSTYGVPSSRSQPTSDNMSSSRNIQSPNVDTLSQTYGAPSQDDVSETYGVPDLMTSAVASSYALISSRSSPSSTYLPAERNSAPSEQYGVPEQRDADSQGYDDARARAFEELQNQEPASYDFGYQIEDQESGSDFGHTETREENSAQGSYFVVLPDGTKQTVEYEADERGFRPRISVEAAAGGDEDAAGARAGGGPY